MSSKDQILRTIFEGREAWLQYLSSLSLTETRKISEHLNEKIADHEQLLEELKLAANIAEAQIEKREHNLENQRTRRVGSGMSIDFLPLLLRS